MSQTTPVVHIVDDDEDLRQSLVFLLQSVGIDALVYPDALTFLNEFDAEEPGIVIVDVRMPGLSGIQLQERLVDQGSVAPIIFCSAHGDVDLSVRVMRAGAVDFLQKPYDPHRMLEVVQTQLGNAREVFDRRARRREVERLLDLLTPREREVLRGVVEGLSSQQIAMRLGMSVKTVDVHRGRVRIKTDAESLTALVRQIFEHRITV